MRSFFLLVFLILVSPLAVRTAQAADDDDNFRPDVLHCEEALGKLAQCCPSFVTTDVSCTYDERQTSGCDFYTTVTVTPAFTESESQCILASSCQALTDTGVCARAQKATDYVSVSRSDSIESPPPYRPSSTHDKVCP